MTQNQDVAVIRVSCPDCGEQLLATTALRLTLFSAGEGSFYEFFCPECYELVRKSADSYAESALMDEDVDVEFIDVPLEATEVHDGPVLNDDDLLDLVLQMRERPYILEQWCEMGLITA